MDVPRVEWPTDPEAARALQARLARRVRAVPLLGHVRHVAGVDAAYDKPTATCVAAAVCYDMEEGAAVEVATATGRVRFPYRSGLLAFREGPIVLDALACLRKPPDVLLVDAHGVAHPRRAGLAAHLGVLLDMPAVGCAKTRLVGHHERVRADRGGWSEIRIGDEVVGRAVRTRRNVKPIYVSVGHLSDLPTATALVLRLAPRFRVPEPLRHAHHEVSQRK